MSSHTPSRAMSKNGISYLLREVIVHSGASSNDVAAPRKPIAFAALRHHLHFLRIGLWLVF